MEFNQDVVSKIIESYTRESGVRNLEREIGSVCRAKAVEYAEAKDAGHTGKCFFEFGSDQVLINLQKSTNLSCPLKTLRKF